MKIVCLVVFRGALQILYKNLHLIFQANSANSTIFIHR